MCRSICTLLLIASLSLVASDKGPHDDVVITLERTTCFGTCPAYKLTIHGDGSLVYEGRKFVRVDGSRTATIDKAAVADLVQAFTDAGYFEFKDHYNSIQNPDGTQTMVSDLPTTYTSLALHGRHKVVEDYIGAPKELRDLEKKIDEATNSRRWIVIDADTVHQQAKAGWNVNSQEAKKLFSEAAMNGDEEVVRAFIEEHIDVNGWKASSPFLFARSSKIVKLLISAGADVNASPKDMFGSPVAYAANLGDVESIKALLQAGGNANQASGEGVTPLMWAAGRGNPEAVSVAPSRGKCKRAKRQRKNRADLRKRWPASANHAGEGGGPEFGCNHRLSKQVSPD
ncbi:MAG TPA: DUF6438 domain-containing protein [Candidatus Dormibacteraeota bacterium]|jgi:hypothetical protein|nr:DUF6438 domain-containing protein [Candidatus Dormibacteraeota bacterium]